MCNVIILSLLKTSLKHYLMLTLTSHTGMLHHPSGNICNYLICLPNHSSYSSKASPHSPCHGCHSAWHPSILCICYGDTMEIKTKDA